MMIGNMNQSGQNLSSPASFCSQPFANVQQQTNKGNSYGCDAERVTHFNLDGEKIHVDL